MTMTEMAAGTFAEGDLLRTPTEDDRRRSAAGKFQEWLATERDLSFADWEQLRIWSVEELTDFWQAVWDYFEIHAHTPPRAVLASDRMPEASWFPGATLNYAEHVFRFDDDDRLAFTARSELRAPMDVTMGQLRDQVRRARSALVDLGVRRGDVVAAYLPNIPETIVAFLAAASLGATWASCAPELGANSVVERLSQIEPSVLFVVTGYRYGGKDISRESDVAATLADLPSVRHVVHVPYHGRAPAGALSWEGFLTLGGKSGRPLEFDPVPFDHPLYVLFSSGTTGKPKAIVHGHGGILLEHLKNHAFHWDLQEGDCVLWFTTTTWMVWNTLVSALLVRASAVLVDGNPMTPDVGFQWRLAEEAGVTLLGLSPPFVLATRNAGYEPAQESDLSRVRQIGVVGSHLPLESHRWLHERFGSHAFINLGSGGTDVCTGLVHGSPLTPEYAGEISGVALGVDAKAFDDRGQVVVGELGELVITQPMPSMPVGLWGDEDGELLRATYFDTFPGVWRHGDWIRFSERGSCVITGRSDATLNRGGVRLGTAEFYRVVEQVPGITDSMVVHLEDDLGPGDLLLFITLAADETLSDAMRQDLTRRLRTALSPRHVPDQIIDVPLIPHNRTGKKLEVPVKRILQGHPVEKVVQLETLADPRALEAFVQLARTRAHQH
jgi:acetoacetyl-CoA synthetase